MICPPRTLATRSGRLASNSFSPMRVKLMTTVASGMDTRILSASHGRTYGPRTLEIVDLRQLRDGGKRRGITRVGRRHGPRTAEPIDSPGDGADCRHRLVPDVTEVDDAIGARAGARNHW